MEVPIYKICERCVMDTSDPKITFNANGVCNHCHDFDTVTVKRWFPNEKGANKLKATFDRLKCDGVGKEYDCIIGLSGGVDSSYLAFVIKNYGLRPLAVHVDAGWNTELAVHNIERIVKYCDYDLHTHVVDWEEMRDLQLAYLKAGVANQDVPQDHIFFASLYHFAVENKINYIISGGNIATESVFPDAWHHSAMDSINLHAIHNRYGKVKLKNYRTINVYQYYLHYPYVYKMKTVRPLNYMPYQKQEALKLLKEKIGYKEYGRKHGESVFTKFFQNYYLPQKFGYDKRRPHLASMILSGQISREEALQELEKPFYDAIELKDDLSYIAKKLQIQKSELTAMITAPGVDYTSFKSWDGIYAKLKSVQRFAETLLGREIKNYA